MAGPGGLPKPKSPPGMKLREDGSIETVETNPLSVGKDLPGLSLTGRAVSGSAGGSLVSMSFPNLSATDWSNRPIDPDWYRLVRRAIRQTGAKIRYDDPSVPLLQLDATEAVARRLAQRLVKEFSMDPKQITATRSVEPGRGATRMAGKTAVTDEGHFSSEEQDDIAYAAESFVRHGLRDVAELEHYYKTQIPPSLARVDFIQGVTDALPNVQFGYVYGSPGYKREERQREWAYGVLEEALTGRPPIDDQTFEDFVGGKQPLGSGGGQGKEGRAARTGAGRRGKTAASKPAEGWRSYAIGLAEEGLISAEDLLLIALRYMSQDDVYGMLDANEMTPRFDEEDEGDGEDDRRDWRDYALELVQDRGADAHTMLVNAINWLTPDETEEMLDAAELTPRFLNDEDDEDEEEEDEDGEDGEDVDTETGSVTPGKLAARTGAVRGKDIASRISSGQLPQGYTLTQADVGKPLTGEEEGFGDVQEIDVGKRVWVKPYGFVMENDAQRDAHGGRGGPGVVPGAGVTAARGMGSHRQKLAGDDPKMDTGGSGSWSIYTELGSWEAGDKSFFVRRFKTKAEAMAAAKQKSAEVEGNHVAVLDGGREVASFLRGQKVASRQKRAVHVDFNRSLKLADGRTVFAEADTEEEAVGETEVEEAPVEGAAAEPIGGGLTVGDPVPGDTVIVLTLDDAMIGTLDELTDDGQAVVTPAGEGGETGEPIEVEKAAVRRVRSVLVQLDALPDGTVRRGLPVRAVKLGSRKVALDTWLHGVQSPEVVTIVTAEGPRRVSSEQVVARVLVADLGPVAKQDDFVQMLRSNAADRKQAAKEGTGLRAYGVGVDQPEVLGTIALDTDPPTRGDITWRDGHLRVSTPDGEDEGPACGEDEAYDTMLAAWGETGVKPDARVWDLQTGEEKIGSGGYDEPVGSGFDY